MERRILTEAKRFAVTHNFQFVWMKRGITYLRKDANSRATRYLALENGNNNSLTSQPLPDHQTAAAASLLSLGNRMDCLPQIPPMINSHNNSTLSSHNSSVVSSCSLGTGSPVSITYNLAPISVAFDNNVQHRLSSSSWPHFYISHLNVRSLAPHFTNIVDLLNSHNFYILALSETWLRPQDDSSCFFLPGYTLIRSDRDSEVSSRVGDVALYINSNWRHEVTFLAVPGSYHCDNRLEVLGINIITSHIRLAVFVVYKPPSCTPAVLIPFESFLHDFTAASNFTICMGDFNVDLSNALSPGFTYINNTLSLKQILNNNLG